MESEDTHPDRLLDFWEWLVEYRTQVILAIVIALGGGMVWYVKKTEQAEAEEKGALELLVAINPDFEIDGADANLTTSARLKKVIADNPDTAAAVNAGILVASALFDEQSYVEAEGEFQKFISLNKTSPLVASALFGIAASREAAKPSEVKEAIAGYQGVVAQHPQSPEAMQARVAMAKIYLRLDKPDTAKATELIELVNGDGQLILITGFWRAEAMRLAARLEPKDKPEPKPEPAPKAKEKK